jgi:hypothetical protein
VLLVGMPGLLHDIVLDALTGHDDIELVCDSRCEDAVSAIGAVEPSTVVWCCRQSPRESTLSDVLYAHPRMRMLMVVGEGRRGMLHELVPRTSVLRELSPQRVLSAVRGGVGEPDQSGGDPCRQGHSSSPRR